MLFKFIIFNILFYLIKMFIKNKVLPWLISLLKGRLISCAARYITIA